MPNPEPEGFQTYHEAPSRVRQPATDPFDNFAIASAVTGLIAIPFLLLVWVVQAWSIFTIAVFAIPLTPVALGILSLGKIRNSNKRGRGLAITGIVLGSITALVLAAAIGIFIAGIAAWVAN